LKILLTGKNGQVGFELKRALAPLGKIVALGSRELDLSDLSAIRETIRQYQPDVIVNPAAHTAVDRAESEEDVAKRVNSEAPGVFAEEAEKRGIPLIHYSTDYVFDGRKEGAYQEEDATSPLGVYGRTKREGEKAIQKACSRSLILRTSWVVGAHGNNFLKTMLRLASEREELKVVADQFGAPTSAALIADVTAHLLRQMMHGDASAFPYGIYHLVARDVTTWHEYAAFVIEFARKQGFPIKVPADKILPIPTSDYPTPARRPQNSQLSVEKLEKTFDLHLPNWQDGVVQILEQILP